jgi:hypothetical protein
MGRKGKKNRRGRGNNNSRPAASPVLEPVFGDEQVPPQPGPEPEPEPEPDKAADTAAAAAAKAEEELRAQVEALQAELRASKQAKEAAQVQIQEAAATNLELSRRSAAAEERAQRAELQSSPTVPPRRLSEGRRTTPPARLQTPDIRGDEVARKQAPMSQATAPPRGGSPGRVGASRGNGAPALLRGMPLRELTGQEGVRSSTVTDGSGPGACNNYSVDLAAELFNTCLCGFPKSDHIQRQDAESDSSKGVGDTCPVASSLGFETGVKGEGVSDGDGSEDGGDSTGSPTKEDLIAQARAWKRKKQPGGTSGHRQSGDVLAAAAAATGGAPNDQEEKEEEQQQEEGPALRAGISVGGACDNFREDIRAPGLVMCVCGFPRDEHTSTPRWAVGDGSRLEAGLAVGARALADPVLEDRPPPTSPCEQSGHATSSSRSQESGQPPPLDITQDDPILGTCWIR